MKRYAIFATLFILVGCSSNGNPVSSDIISAINEAISLKIPIYFEGYGDRNYDFNPAEFNKYFSGQIEIKSETIVITNKSIVGRGGITMIPINRIKGITFITETKIQYEDKLLNSEGLEDLPKAKQEEIKKFMDGGSAKTKTEKTKLYIYFQWM